MLILPNPILAPIQPYVAGREVAIQMQGGIPQQLQILSITWLGAAMLAWL